jgi:hypothetical protein
MRARSLIAFLVPGGTQMHSVPYREIEHARPGSSAGEQRIATTATLVAVAVCMIVAEVHGAPTPVRQQEDNPPAVRIVDPEFCKNQTWPYIDALCLKRSQVAAVPTVNSSPVAINTADTSVAVVGANNVAGSAILSAARTAVTTPNDGASQPAAPAAPPTQTTPAAVSAFGAPRGNEISQDAAEVAADNASYQRLTDFPQQHRPRHDRRRMRFLFGFRF